MDRTNQYKKIIVPLVQKFLPKARIILYGSRARGDWQEGSDIDVALDTGSPIPLSVLGLIDEALEGHMPISWDIVDMAVINSELRANILKEGIIWHNYQEN